MLTHIGINIIELVYTTKEAVRELLDKNNS